MWARAFTLRSLRLLVIDDSRTASAPPRSSMNPSSGSAGLCTRPSMAIDTSASTHAAMSAA